MAPFLRAENASCARDGLSEVRNVSAAFVPGGISFLCGAKGSGKNLLLRLLGLLETADAGDIFFHETSAGLLTEEARRDLRSRQCGFVFAEPFLLEQFSVAENVAMPLFKVSGAALEDARAQVSHLLDLLGLARGANAPADSLPLIDQWKVSLARALAHHPQLVTIENADELLADAALGEAMHALTVVSKSLPVTIVATLEKCEGAPADARILELQAGEIIRDTQQHPSVF
ncbi:MAG: lipoprotein-releasing system ATP-binding protein [Chthoniobacter sp.]|jgi:lipoprotein-releasing system ATP-binding protein|nr:lipoprotein-releasing system ATP-binding protein [Chthoniobacter sp.]